MRQKKPLIIVKPRSGLGNRMRAVSSFIYLKNLINAELQVIWQPDDGLNAEYSDIFQDNENFSLIKPNILYSLFVSRSKLLNSKIGIIRYSVKTYNELIKKILQLDVLLLNDEVTNLQYVKEICENKHRILIMTGYQCLEYPEGVRTFVPADHINLIINKIAAGFKKNMIGMHIRRTDHVVSMNKSPIYLFENKILEYIESKRDIGVFLATDDPEVESYFKDKYPEIIFTYEKTFGRDTKEGMLDAVVDLYLLSKTEKIYGSYWSSYSGIASLLGDIKLQSLHL